MAADPPPHLLSFESPLFLHGTAEASATAANTTTTKRSTTKNNASQLEDIINSILPPRMWDQADGSTWMQYTSKLPATREDVKTLEIALEQRLVQRQARSTGLCPVREDLYRQAFDELLREVTLDLPERGLLLLRVRDEIRMTLDAYRTLYEASITFGVRKQLQAENGIAELENTLVTLSERKKELETTVTALRAKIDVVERRQGERRVLDEKRRAEELAYLKHQAKHLDAFLKSMPKA